MQAIIEQSVTRNDGIFRVEKHNYKLRLTEENPNPVNIIEFILEQVQTHISNRDAYIGFSLKTSSSEKFNLAYKRRDLVTIYYIVERLQAFLQSARVYQTDEYIYCCFSVIYR